MSNLHFFSIGADVHLCSSQDQNKITNRDIKPSLAASSERILVHRTDLLIDDCLTPNIFSTQNPWIVSYFTTMWKITALATRIPTHRNALIPHLVSLLFTHVQLTADSGFQLNRYSIPRCCSVRFFHHHLDPDVLASHFLRILLASWKLTSFGYTSMFIDPMSVGGTQYLLSYFGEY